VELSAHTSSVFNTVQTPSVVVNNYQLREGERGFKPSQFKQNLRTRDFIELVSKPTDKTQQTTPTQTDKTDKSADNRTHKTASKINTLTDAQPVTVDFLNALYKIPSNIGK
jgi:hypothetical protein